MAWINAQAPRLWLLGILSSLGVNLHKIQKNFSQRQFHLMVQSAPMGLDKEMKKTTKDTVQDLIDLIIPMSLLGYVNVSSGTVGLAGSITSLMSAASIYPRE
ncbi:Pex11p [Paramicrosporidium saccamoebae]|uniref:Pex11p n=1 Tax=Paramicrosporidium saccamoebae TaxID=1246581 RepID=A0A2H9TGE4_9FUNG|nr:Pex11p [Paramicrosporidium saccamoebae]